MLCELIGRWCYGATIKLINSIREKSRYGVKLRGQNQKYFLLEYYLHHNLLWKLFTENWPFFAMN